MVKKVKENHTEPQNNQTFLYPYWGESLNREKQQWEM